MTDCGVYCSSSLCGGTRLAEHMEHTRGYPVSVRVHLGQSKWVSVEHRPHDRAVKVGNLSTGPIIVQLKWVTFKHRPHDRVVKVEHGAP